MHYTGAWIETLSILPVGSACSREPTVIPELNVASHVGIGAERAGELRSMTSIFSPVAASAVPRLMAVVVLPTPPFGLAIARTQKLGTPTGESVTNNPLARGSDELGWAAVGNFLYRLEVQWTGAFE